MSPSVVVNHAHISTRGKPDVEGGDVWSAPRLFLGLNPCLEYLKTSFISTSITYLLSDKQNQNQKGLVKSEKGNKSVSNASVNTCVNNIFLRGQEIKKWPLEILEKKFPPTISNILAGMVLGSQESISVELKHKIKVTGMQHVMVASGSNIGLVYYSALSVFSRFLASKRAALGGLSAVYGYLWLIGAEPPVIRAALMISLTVLARSYLGRQQRTLWLLGLVALIMLAMNLEWFSSISFQLSFASSLGILLWMPLLASPSQLLTSLDGLNASPPRVQASLSFIQKLVSVFYEALLVTVAAQLFTLPLILYHFRESGTLLLVANTLLVPLVPIITLSGFLFLVIVPVLELFQLASLTYLVSLLPLLPTTLFLDLLDRVSVWQWPVLSIDQFPAWGVGGWWILTLAGLWLLSFRKRKKHYNPNQFFLE